MSQIEVSSPLNRCCHSTESQSAAANVNPTMYYDIQQTAKPATPPYPSLPAVAFEVNGAGSAYVWQPLTGEWK